MTIKRVDRGRNHWYTIDGRKADGVTTLLSDGLPKPALVRWGINSVSEYVTKNREHLRECFDWMDDAQLYDLLKGVPYANRDAAANRGTEIHHIAEKLVHGEEVDVPEEIAGHVRACVQFLDDWQVTPVLVEAVVASRKWNYAGSLDLVGGLPDGRTALFDYKSSKSGIFPETILQLAAYRYAEVWVEPDGTEHPMADVGITDVYAVHITADGYKVHPLPADELAHRVFLHVAYCARWAKASKGLVGEPIPAPEWEVAS